MQNLKLNMVVITPMGEGRIQGQVAQSDPPKVFVRIPVENLPPEMRPALHARRRTCAMFEFEPEQLVVPVIAGKKETIIRKQK